MIMSLWILDMPTGPNECNQCGATEKLTRVRHTFLSIGRMAAFVHDRCDWKLPDDIKTRLDMVAKDIASLDKFENSLTGRVQLLLDAAAGGVRLRWPVRLFTVALSHEGVLLLRTGVPI